MMKTTTKRVGYSPRIILVTALVICVSVLSAGAWQIDSRQASPNQASDKEDVQKRIAILMREALREGEGNVNGIKTWSKVPPSTKAIEEIKDFGDDSVPALTKYLDSDHEPERALAVEFLGLLGGRRIIPPLRKAIRHDTSRAIRVQALRWISQAPWELASPVIHEASEKDLDPKVREAAKDILVNHPPE